jgi:hypothetical protein
MRTSLLALLFTVAVAFPQTETSFENRPALLLSNDKLDLTILPQGGALASLTLRGDSSRMNPMWEPIRMAREAGQEPRFGSSMGHFVCVDGFGPVSEEERKAGLQGHGEAHRLPWTVVKSAREGNAAVITFSVKLPVHQEVLTRTHRVVDGENVVYVESELESLLAFDRPVVWAEHATIGSPFLEPGQTVVDMPAARSRTRPYEPRDRGLPHRLASGEDFTWPMAPGTDGKPIDVRAAPVPPNSGDHTTCLMDPARRLVFVTALHPAKGLLFGYVFRREDFPWVQSWENYPSNGKLARGLEFSTQPFDVPRREAISLGNLFDGPTYRWLPALSKIQSRFLIFYTGAANGFRKVDDVRLEGGKLIIEDRTAGKRMELKASGTL